MRSAGSVGAHFSDRNWSFQSDLALARQNESGRLPEDPPAVVVCRYGSVGATAGYSAGAIRPGLWTMPGFLRVASSTQSE